MHNKHGLECSYHRNIGLKDDDDNFRAPSLGLKIFLGLGFL